MIMSADTIWIAICTVLVFFMQTGFAMLETGFTRKKNSCNVIMKNIMDFAVGSIFYWILGFGIMFGATTGVVGVIDLFSNGDCSAASQTIPQPVFMAWQLVFCATSATIVSGAMAERTAFKSYLIYSAVMSAVVYPISGCWIWNANGWLAQLGFHDFAGGTAVHLLGGSAAFAGAAVLGARIGKYDKKKKSRAILGQNIPLAALGAFILWVSWFGFNGGSTVCATGDDVLTSMGRIFVTTNMAAASAATATMFLTWLRYGKPDVSMTLNGALAGLVAITAGCDAVSVPGAFVIGIIAGLVIVFAVEFFDQIARIDDPVGAISVHGVCGALGTLLVGVFAVDGGLLYGGGSELLIIQATGVAAVAAYIGIVMTLIFQILDKTIGLRVSTREEIAGLDMEEHGLASSYADFMPAAEDFHGAVTAQEAAEAGASFTHVTAALPAAGRPKMTKIVIITSQLRFEILKEALDKLGITGMTVTKVLGYGLQKGNTEYYRGAEVSVHLLPKVKVELVVSAIPVAAVVAAAKKVLYTGKYGDGKIFIYDVENVVKIRTGEEGYEALQDEPIEA